MRRSSKSCQSAVKQLSNWLLQTAVKQQSSWHWFLSISSRVLLLELNFKCEGSHEGWKFRTRRAYNLKVWLRPCSGLPLPNQVSNSFQTACKQLADSLQTACKQLANSLQTAFQLKQLSNSFQTGFKQLSKLFVCFLMCPFARQLVITCLLSYNNVKM